MPEPDPTRLDDLKRRWAQDPGSRVYLHLADEHRKHGQLEDAESVLEKGLESRPGDLSGLVALGRCRLDLGKVGAAILSLEAVTARDPAHMVASKLLVEAHLQRGDAGKAEDHLGTCRLLNDRDPELDDFEQRLRRLRGGALEEPAAEAAPEPEAAPPEAAPPRSVAPSNGDEIFHLGAVPPAPSLEALWLEPPPSRRPAEPFQGLISGSAAAFAAGEIFRVEAAPPPPPPAVDEDAPTERIEVEPPLTEPVETVGEAEDAGYDETPTEKVEIRRPPITAAPPAAEAPPAEELPAEEPPAEELLAEEPPAAEESPEEEAATVTLGGLYLQQGHPEDAARIFEQVLELEPDNPAALAGLNLARGPRPSPPLTAMDLLADRSLSGTVPRGLTGKKLLVLTNYLKHIRSFRERDHVH